MHQEAFVIFFLYHLRQFLYKNSNVFMKRYWAVSWEVMPLQSQLIIKNKIDPRAPSTYILTPPGKLRRYMSFLKSMEFRTSLNHHTRKRIATPFIPYSVVSSSAPQPFRYIKRPEVAFSWTISSSTLFWWTLYKQSSKRACIFSSQFVVWSLVNRARLNKEV